MQETTRATQADFQPEQLLNAALVSGTHPVSAPGGLLNRVWVLWDGTKRGTVNAERVREIAGTITPLRQIVEQYIDPATGKPRAECADSTNPAVVALKDETACFGRKCGFAEGCFKQCSLGPSHNAQGQPLGVPGRAPAYNTEGQQSGQEMYDGVLKVGPDGQPVQPPRHRDNSCITLSLFLQAVGVPPAPTAPLADKLWEVLPTALTAIEQGLQAQPNPTPKQQAPAPAPQPAPVPAPQPIGDSKRAQMFLGTAPRLLGSHSITVNRRGRRSR